MAIKTYMASLLTIGSVLPAPTLAAPISAARFGGPVCTGVLPDRAVCTETCAPPPSDQDLDCARGGGDGIAAKSTEAEAEAEAGVGAERGWQLLPPGLFDRVSGIAPAGQIVPLDPGMLEWFRSLPEWQGLDEKGNWLPGDMVAEEEEETTADGEADATATDTATAAAQRS